MWTWACLIVLLDLYFGCDIEFEFGLTCQSLAWNNKHVSCYLFSDNLLHSSIAAFLHPFINLWCKFHSNSVPLSGYFSAFVVTQESGFENLSMFTVTCSDKNWTGDNKHTLTSVDVNMNMSYCVSRSFFWMWYWVWVWSNMPESGLKQ